MISYAIYMDYILKSVGFGASKVMNVSSRFLHCTLLLVSILPTNRCLA